MFTGKLMGAPACGRLLKQTLKTRYGIGANITRSGQSEWPLVVWQNSWDFPGRESGVDFVLFGQSRICSVVRVWSVSSSWLNDVMPRLSVTSRDNIKLGTRSLDLATTYYVKDPSVFRQSKAFFVSKKSIYFSVFIFSATQQADFVVRRFYLIWFQSEIACHPSHWNPSAISISRYHMVKVWSVFSREFRACSSRFTDCAHTVRAKTWKVIEILLTDFQVALWKLSDRNTWLETWFLSSFFFFFALQLTYRSFSLTICE